MHACIVEYSVTSDCCQLTTVGCPNLIESEGTGVWSGRQARLQYEMYELVLTVQPLSHTAEAILDTEFVVN